jgi:hypothetical protein
LQLSPEEQREFRLFAERAAAADRRAEVMAEIASS